MAHTSIVVMDCYTFSPSRRSYSEPFTAGGYNWCVVALPAEDEDDHMSLYLDVVDSASLPRGWAILARVRFTLLNRISRSSSITRESLHWFHERERYCGFTKVVPVNMLDRRFLLNGKLVVQVEVDVLEDFVMRSHWSVPRTSETRPEYLTVPGTSETLPEYLPEYLAVPRASETLPEFLTVPGAVPGPYDMFHLDALAISLRDQLNSSCQKEQMSPESLTNTEGPRAADASALRAQVRSLFQKEQKSPESLTNTEGPRAADAGASGDQVRSSCQKEKQPQDASEEGLEDDDDDDSSEHTSDDDDDSSEYTSDDDEDVVSDVVGDKSSMNKPEALKNACKALENDGAEFKYAPFPTKPEQETVEINGFQVLSSQENDVRQIFEKHPEIASRFRPRNQELKNTYMSVLLKLVKKLCKPPQELAEDDLIDSDKTLLDLTDAGFELTWLKTKLEEVSAEKKKAVASEVQLQELGKEVEKLKLKVSELEAELRRERRNGEVARTPLSFSDIVSLTQM